VAATVELGEAEIQQASLVLDRSSRASAAPALPGGRRVALGLPDRGEELQAAGWLATARR
jgi:hypothetical protein